MLPLKVPVNGVLHAQERHEVSDTRPAQPLLITILDHPPRDLTDESCLGLNQLITRLRGAALELGGVEHCYGNQREDNRGEHTGFVY